MQCMPIFREGIRSRVGDGGKPIFGKTNGVERFLRRFVCGDFCTGLTLRKKVADYMTQGFQGGVCQPLFRRNAFDWEVLIIINLLDRLNSHQIRGDQQDSRYWKMNRNGLFTVKSCYEQIVSAMSVDFPWKEIWYKLVPTEVQFFLLTAILGKI